MVQFILRDPDPRLLPDPVSLAVNEAGTHKPLLSAHPTSCRGCPTVFFFVAEQTLSLAKEVGYSAYFSAGLRAPGYPRNAFFITRSPLRPEQHLHQVTFRTRPAAGVVGKIISGEERMLLVGSCSHPTAWGYHRPAPGPDP